MVDITKSDEKIPDLTDKQWQSMKDLFEPRERRQKILSEGS